MAVFLSSTISVEKGTGLNKEIVHYVSFDMCGKKNLDIFSLNIYLSCNNCFTERLFIF